MRLSEKKPVYVCLHRVQCVSPGACSLKMNGLRSAAVKLSIFIQAGVATGAFIIGHRCRPQVNTASHSAQLINQAICTRLRHFQSNVYYVSVCRAAVLYAAGAPPAMSKMPNSQCDRRVSDANRLCVHLRRPAARASSHQRTMCVFDQVWTFKIDFGS